MSGSEEELDETPDKQNENSLTAPSVPIEVNPVQRDGLRVPLEECLRQLQFEMAVLQRSFRSWLAVTANHPNLHSIRTFGVKWSVFPAVLPKSQNCRPDLIPMRRVSLCRSTG